MTGIIMKHTDIKEQAMTDIPKPGSVWVNIHSGDRAATVVWADHKTVVYDSPYIGRNALNLDRFKFCYTPAPKPKVKVRRWVNLYANSMSTSYATEEEAKTYASPNAIETRLIEWEVEEE
jgi:hypothetical protein